MTKEGDKYKCVTKMSVGDEVVEFKLGEKFTEKSMGVEVQNLFTVEGDAVIGEHVFEGSNGKMTSITKRFLKGDQLIVESSHQDQCDEEGLKTISSLLFPWHVVKTVEKLSKVDINVKLSFTFLDQRFCQQCYLIFVQCTNMHYDSLYFLCVI